MRLKSLLVLTICALLIWEADAASKDRKKNRQRNRNEDTETEEEGMMKAGQGFSEDRRKETKDRVMQLVEKGEERKHEKKDEESSEEKDDDKKKNETAEIHIPKRFRRTFELSRAKEINEDEEQRNSRHDDLGHEAHRYRNYRRRRAEHELKKAKEVNDGEKKPIENPPSQTHQRSRRNHELKKAKELNDGEKTPIENAPSQTHKCDSGCHHRARREHFDELITRLRREPGNKEMGHRTASHPHRKNIKKAGKKAQKEGKGSRALRSLQNEDNQTKPITDHRSQEGLKYNVEHKFVRTHGLKKPVINQENKPAAVHRIRRHRRKINDVGRGSKDDLEEVRELAQDKTVVSADVGEIREY